MFFNTRVTACQRTSLRPRATSAVFGSITLCITFALSAQTAFAVSSRDIYDEVSRQCQKLHRAKVSIRPTYSRGNELFDRDNAWQEDIAYVNGSALERLPSYVAEFELYSLCGRWNMHESNEPQNTKDADCWAITSMTRTGQASRNDIQRVIDWFVKQGSMRMYDTTSKPSARERAKNMYSCNR